MSALWRHLTHPEGMTVSLLAKAAGMDKHQVRAELVRDELHAAQGAVTAARRRMTCCVMSRCMSRYIIAKISPGRP